MERIRLRQSEIKIPPYCNDRKFCSLKCLWIKQIAPGGGPSAPILDIRLERRASDFEYRRQAGTGPPGVFLERLLDDERMRNLPSECRDVKRVDSRGR